MKRKGYGASSISERWYQLVREHVPGEVVWDLGAGNGYYTSLLIQEGASRVIAVDKEQSHDWQVPQDERVTRIRCSFSQVRVPEVQPVAYLSFPSNYPLPGLVDLLKNFRKVIYFGSNLGNTSCGDVSLFEHLSSREVLGSITRFNTTLTVYGPEPRGSSLLLPEEFGALNTLEAMDLEEAEAALTAAGRLLGGYSR